MCSFNGVLYEYSSRFQVSGVLGVGVLWDHGCFSSLLLEVLFRWCLLVFAFALLLAFMVGVYLQFSPWRPACVELLGPLSLTLLGCLPGLGLGG